MSRTGPSQRCQIAVQVPLVRSWASDGVDESGEVGMVFADGHSVGFSGEP